MAEHESKPAAEQPLTDAAATPPGRPHAPSKKPRRAGHIVREIVVRVYALLLACVIGTVCMMAIVYLFRYVFAPAKLPAAVTQWQGHLDAASLRQTNVPGITGDAGRAPMAHYHKVERWFQSDPLNGCTASGCHEPLPHGPKTKIAAFANLHVTFMDCMVCHADPKTNPTTSGSMHWISSSSYHPQEIPPVLKLLGIVQQLGSSKEDAQAAHGQIVALLKQVLGVVGRDAMLEGLMARIDSSMPDSPLWRKSVRALAQELPRHARGEYAAKLARGEGSSMSKFAAQIQKYQKSTGETARKDLKDEMHKGILAQPSACATCHTTEKSGMMDFESLGYPAARAKSLRELPLARMAQQIREGEVFNLPKLLEGGDGR